jgi:hypothetical protein
MHRGSRITCFLQGLLRMLLQALQAVSICTFVPVRKQVLVLVKPPAGVFLQALRMMLQTLTYALSRCSSLAAPSSPRFEQCAASPLPLRHIHISIFTFFFVPSKASNPEVRGWHAQLRHIPAANAAPPSPHFSSHSAAWYMRRK